MYENMIFNDYYLYLFTYVFLYVNLDLLKSKFVLLTHDWGAFYGLLYTNQHPDIVSKLILCDVGILNFKQLSTFTISSIFYLSCYQICFSIIFLINELISKWLAQLIFIVYGLLFAKLVNPCPHDRLKVHVKDITIDKFYPYYYLWRRYYSPICL